MPSTRHFARPHIGKVPMKFYFRAQDITVLLPNLDIRGSLVLVWKRGYRKTSTGPPEPFEIKEELNSVDGSLVRSASTTQDLAQICTMFKNSRTKAFEPKLCTFTLRSATDDSKLGSTTLDLSSYATPEISSDLVELSLLDGQIVIRFTLTSHWLKNVNTAGSNEDDVSSCQSLGSYTDVEEEESITSIAVEKSVGTPLQQAAFLSSPAASANEPAAASSSGTFTPMNAEERARIGAAREAAIERRWAQEEEKVKDAQREECLKEEIRELKEQLKHSRSEAKYLRDRMEQLAAENRVLRRDPKKGKRDAVIQQLEVELERQEQERSDMEEQLSAAFGGQLKELQARVTGLTSERDRLLVQLAESSGRKGGFLTKS
eukprot:CAMPEP_0119332338 /NCGR_PEP_ID=MMETSP1333-20130426/82509_1 /TAXON_ID=418940 /ORGANISM="Scyphosphaera apsteinii, Strain RCC1455" /LENGTH=374 /DNA_ID=CAMNT_0007342143 /DNA_START=23 /DNA_END=1147 /DNA_ORIENTATION=-